MTVEEVVGSITTLTGDELSATRVLNIRNQYGGAQAGLVLITLSSVHALLNIVRLIVYMVSCSVRQREQAARCYRCFASGYKANKCIGPDRSACCHTQKEISNVDQCLRFYRSTLGRVLLRTICYL